MILSTFELKQINYMATCTHSLGRQYAFSMKKIILGNFTGEYELNILENGINFLDAHSFIGAVN